MDISSNYSLQERMRTSSYGIDGADGRGEVARSERGLAFGGEDTVTISEKAREMFETSQAGQDGAAEDAASAFPKNDDAKKEGPLGGLFDDFDPEALGAVGEAIGSVMESFQGSNEDNNDQIKALQKQIQEAQKELQKATESLQRAQQEARSDPEISSENDSPDVKTAQTEELVANNKLLQLQQQLAKAMKEACGASPGGGGQIQGTRAEGGCGSGSGSHIGEASDPYAAAQAFEAAESGG